VGGGGGGGLACTPLLLAAAGGLAVPLIPPHSSLPPEEALGASRLVSHGELGGGPGLADDDTAPAGTSGSFSSQFGVMPDALQIFRLLHVDPSPLHPIFHSKPSA